MPPPISHPTPSLCIISLLFWVFANLIWFIALFLATRHGYCSIHRWLLQTHSSCISECCHHRVPAIWFYLNWLLGWCGNNLNCHSLLQVGLSYFSPHLRSYLRLKIYCLHSNRSYSCVRVVLVSRWSMHCRLIIIWGGWRCVWPVLWGRWWFCWSSCWGCCGVRGAIGASFELLYSL